MPITTLKSICIILIIAFVTFITRVIPFVLFPNGEKVPKVIHYLGKVLPPAVIGMLIIYCFKSVDVLKSPFGISEFAAGITVVILHIWKRNNLLSIGAGTILYMFFVQTIF